MDDETFNELQKLKDFVSLVGSLEQCDKQTKSKLNGIIYQIENINNPETYRNWDVFVDVYVEDPENPIKSDFSFLRHKWAIFYEFETLTIESASVYTDDPAGLDNEIINYCGTLYFSKDLPDDCKQKYMDEDLDLFTNGLRNFVKNNTLPIWDFDISVDIDE